MKAVETRSWLMGTLIAIVISVGGLVEIVPLYFQTSVIKPSPGIRPYTPLALAGRDVYVREGCYNCHSQMIRPLLSETERYGHYSIAGEAVYDHPFPVWLQAHRTGPRPRRRPATPTSGIRPISTTRATSCRSPNMPGFPWLAKATIDGDELAAKMRVLVRLGVPYTPAEIEAAGADVNGKTEMDALITYLQSLKFHGEAQP